MTPKMLEALRLIGPNGTLTQVHRHRHTTDVKFSCANRVMSKRIRGATASALIRGGYVADKGGIGGLDFSDYRMTDKGRAVLASSSEEDPMERQGIEHKMTAGAIYANDCPCLAFAPEVKGAKK